MIPRVCCHDFADIFRIAVFFYVFLFSGFENIKCPCILIYVERSTNLISRQRYGGDGL